jgi:hypothetical protein
MMDWENLRDIFEAAWPLKGQERERLLEERCGANEKLHAELRTLLEAYDEENRGSEPWFRAEGAVARGALLCAGGRREERRLALAGAAAARRQAFGADAAGTRSAEKQLAKCGEAGK